MADGEGRRAYASYSLIPTLLLMLVACAWPASAQTQAQSRLPAGVTDLEPLWRLCSDTFEACERASDGPSWVSRTDFAARGKAPPPTVSMRARVALTTPNEPIGVAIGHFLGAWSVRANGIELAHGGDLSTGWGSQFFNDRAFAVPAAAVGATGELVIDVRVRLAPHIYWSGGRYPLEGTPHLVGPLTLVDTLRRAEVGRARAKLLVPNLVEALTFVLLAVFQLVLYRSRRELKEYLYQSMAFLCFAVWLVAPELSIFGVPLEVTGRLAAFSSLQVALSVASMWHLLHRGPLPSSARGLVVLLLLAPVGRLLVPDLFYTVVPYAAHMLLLLLGLVWIVRWVVRAALRGDTEGRTMLVGLAGLGVCFSGQVAGALLAIPPERGIGLLLSHGAVLGMVFYGIAVTVALATRFTRSLADLDAAHQQLLLTHDATARFVPVDFLRLLGRESIREVALGDRTARDLVVLFSDVRGFTSLAESMTAEQTIEFINEWLAEAEGEITRAGGFIDKYIGDAIMALFESPTVAVQASVGCFRALDRFNARRSALGRPAVGVGIGLHRGPLVLGSVGSATRLSCTVIGDSVNLASRVESLTKRYGAGLLVTDAVASALGPKDAALRELDCVIVKGKAQPVSLFEVLDVLEAPTREARIATLGDFAQGRARYLAGDPEGALSAFGACLARDPSDKAAEMYRIRCQAQLRDGVPADFDGVARLDSK